jgi:hypothetical protein
MMNAEPCYFELDVSFTLVSLNGSYFLLQLMNLLFSFLEPNRSHSVMLAGYFSKVMFSLVTFNSSF